MRTQLRFSLLALGIAASAALSANSSAAIVDISDNAASPGYDAGWVDGSYGPNSPSRWELRSTSPAARFFIGSSTTNGVGDPDGDGDIDTPRNGNGRAWGLLAAPYTVAWAGRSGFNDSVSGLLVIGTTLNLDMDNGIGLPGGEQGWFLTGLPTNYDLSDALYKRTFAVLAISGQPNYIVYDGPEGTPRDTGVPLTDQGVHFAFTLQTENTYSLAITPLIDGSSTTTIAGVLATPADVAPGSAATLILYDNSAGSSAAQAVYFNNIATTPEPGSLALLGVSGLFLVRRRSRIA
jgi:hypothetical protein